MTAVPEPMMPVRDAEDVVGGRTLVAVQAINISRLSTHPVPTVPGTLIVVAGQGPKDSNGAGKSSFIAAITALLGDEQWRFASGARAVAELLFNAEPAATGRPQGVLRRLRAHPAPDVVFTARRVYTAPE